MFVGVFNHTQDFQEAMAEFSQLYPVEILQEMLNGSLSNPSLNISSLLPSGLAYTDPQFFHDQASNITSTTQARPSLPLVYTKEHLRCQKVSTVITCTCYRQQPCVISQELLPHCDTCNAKCHLQL